MKQQNFSVVRIEKNVVLISQQNADSKTLLMGFVATKPVDKASFKPVSSATEAS